MSSLAAASLVIGLMLIIGGPLLYWVFYKMDSPSFPEDLVRSDRSTVNNKGIGLIETSLGVKLPKQYIHALGSADLILDNVSLLDKAESIIEATLLYRKGLGELEPWPEYLVYIGDEADASPYILSCDDGSVIRSDKGDITRPPITEFKEVNEFLSSFE